MRRHGLILVFLALLLAPTAQAQSEAAENTERRTVQFNGLGRTVLQQTRIGGTLLDTDTTSVERVADGNFLLDLALNAQPNDATEVQAVVRLRNEFGGFFGAGVTLEVRELWARGVVADVFEYRVGDMDVSMTPYTLYLPSAEGQINLPEVFRPQQEVIDYELFYTDNNARRLQGAKLGFGLTFASILDDIDVKSFIARTRPTDFRTTPTRLLSGGQAQISSQPFGPWNSKGTLGFNISYTWDDLKSGDANDGLRNSVYTFNFDVAAFNNDRMGLHVIGEMGESRLSLEGNDATDFTEDDTFVDVGLRLNWKNPAVSISASFVDVGPDFFSSAAQSRRVDFTRDKSFYHRIGNTRDVRATTLFDLSRDIALHTFTLSDRLMDYDPRFSNVLPYGPATPNRRGFVLKTDYAPVEGFVEAHLHAALLQELRGQGTTELKDFFLLRGRSNVHLDRIADWDRKVAATLGFQMEQTTRGGVPLEEIDLTSSLIEVGVSAEVYRNLELLLGVKRRASNGNEYVPLVETFNDVKDFPEPFVIDDAEVLLGTGFRYNFKEGVYLTLQYQRFSYSNDATAANDYRLRQLFVQYSMTF